MMKNYIVFDLEWNQSFKGKEDTKEGFPFEIIEIGAVRLDEHLEIQDSFHRLIKPQVYLQMHHAISKVTHLNIEELQQQGIEFLQAAEQFLEWCGSEAIFCTWGSMDLTELQRNMRYYGMESPFPFPLFYYDVQKLYGLFTGERKSISLDAAAESLNLIEERPFHRALDDAWYTGRVLACMDMEALSVYRSVDYFRLPAEKGEEIRIEFPEYSKYVSRAFPTKEEAMADKAVVEMRCRSCGRLLRKKIRWFTPNQKQYYALALCPEHGYLKGKIRMKHTENDWVYAVRTLKSASEEEVAAVTLRRDEMRKKRARKNRLKKKKKHEERRL